jgi:chromosome segregation protein
LIPLKSASDKTKEYNALFERLKNLDVNIFLEELKKNEAAIARLEENLAAADKNINAENGFIAESEARLENFKQNSKTLETEKDDANFELAELRSQIEQADNDVKLLAEKNLYIEKELARLAREIEKNKSDDSLIAELKRDLGEKKERLSRFKSEMDGARDELERFNLRIKEREAEFENLNAALVELLKKESAEKIDLKNLAQNYAKLESQKEELNNKAAENKAAVAALEKQIARIESEIGAINIKETQNAVEILNVQKAEKESALNDARQKRFELNVKLRDAVSKRDVLEDLKKNYEGFSQSVKATLKENLPGIRGAVGELAEVPQKYERAIEIALGAYAQNIVADTEEDAKRAIEFLKKTNAGRAAFLPLSTIRSRRAAPVKGEGVEGLACDLAKFDPLYKNIFENILGRVVICDSLDRAISLNRKFKNEFRLVTLEGDAINIGGSMAGGSYKSDRLNIFGRGRQLSELNLLADELKSRLGSAFSAEEKLSDEFNKIINALENKKSILKIDSEQINKLNQSLALAGENLKNLLAVKNEIETRDKILIAELISANGAITEKEIEIENFALQISEAKNNIENFQSATRENKSEEDEKTRRLTDLKIEIGRLEAQTEEAERNLKKSYADKSKAEKRMRDCEIEIEKQKNLIINNANTISEKKSAKDALFKSQADKGENLKEILAKTGDVLLKIETEEQSIKSRLETVSKLEQEKTRAAGRKEQTEAERAKLFGEMWEKYEVTRQSALEFPALGSDLNKLRAEAGEIKTNIRELGAVNPAALEEYARAKEKFDFLSEQREDILLAEKKLISLIRELTQMMETQFTEKLAEISDNFNFVFREMFDGGKAYLKLKDGEILESDIEIIAQPPGKNLAGMNLLSGGERALTAIALLFGILKMKPSPFCVLDEIEAALDDANIKRYADFIKKLSSEIQFIIITHRKGAMEAADVLYGVTMEERGVSKIISVDLREARQAL